MPSPRPAPGPPREPEGPADGEQGGAGTGLSEDTKISPIKVAGQALAAVTTAGVGAFVAGAEGTVTGAALSSVVTTVGDALYQRSLERTRDRIKTTVRSRRRPGDPEEPAGGPPDEPATRVAPGPGPAPTQVVPGGDATRAMPDGGATRAMPGGDATRAMPDGGATRAMPGGDATRAMPGGDGTRAMHSPPPPPDDTPTEVLSAPDGEPGDTGKGRSNLRRYAVLVSTALLIFLVAMVAITGIERVKGSPLAGGPPGTSVGSVVGRTAEPTTTPSTTAPADGESTGTSAPTTTTTAPERTTTGQGGREEGGDPTTTSRAPGLDDVVPTGLLPGN